jgi:hypothetical protein
MGQDFGINILVLFQRPPNNQLRVVHISTTIVTKTIWTLKMDVSEFSQQNLEVKLEENNIVVSGIHRENQGRWLGGIVNKPNKLAIIQFKGEHTQLWDIPESFKDEPNLSIINQKLEDEGDFIIYVQSVRMTTTFERPLHIRQRI